MREIKFRAWVDGKMYQNVGVVGNIVVIEYESDEAHDDVNLEPTYYGVRDETIKIMQYTGLKDKNGKEIYEGDVLKHQSGTLGKVKYSEKHAAFLVHYTDIFGKQVMDHIYEEMISQTEIIGNVFENSEHLKEGVQA